MPPRIAVVVPVKDRSALLGQTLASLTAQTLPDWEARVVDDGSKPAEREASRELCAADERIHFRVREGSAGGAPRCRNLGWAGVSAPLVVFLDSDDLLAPTALEQRVAGMEAAGEGCDLLVRRGEIFAERPGDLGIPWNDDAPGDDLDRFLSCDTPWQTTAPTWRRAALETLGGWDEQASSWQDWELHIRALACGLRVEKQGAVDHFHRRTHAGSMRRSHDSLEQLKDRARLFASVHDVLEANGGLTTDREALLRGLFLRFAFKSARLHAEIEISNVFLQAAEKVGVIANEPLREAMRTARAIADGDEAGEEDEGVIARFPELLAVCHSPGRDRARGDA